MASIRTARLIAAAAAVPLAAALFSGVAQADNGAFAEGFSNAANVGQAGVGGSNSGISSQTQQVAQGGGSNESSTATAVGWGNVIDQSDTAVVFTNLW
ncbi:hypothetical protein SRB5_39610 [Streptomyces sp. RB5]|uniref:Secreted protein n=1 Tax=Streptomyces smaragdinus TaxID=2585196 RepID=A0A7K0CK17_9ACTN|nr:hypothetical protein [Streptomyces smaragdinus]MQY13806.1 hypothetical protein [Streptomyces smaragdinus]